jgi:hypothetical protein
MAQLMDYIKQLQAVIGMPLNGGQLFAKVLTPNDDSGRHGVLIPSEAYGFFPQIDILDKDQNQTLEFDSMNADTGAIEKLAYKYYERYPERRITRLNPIINQKDGDGLRLQVFVRFLLPDGSIAYLHDAANQRLDSKFQEVWLAIGGDLAPTPGAYIIAPIEFNGFEIDEALEDLLSKFDGIRGNWVDSLRAGDTGVGFTFESLLGIKENNDQTADFRGIELKCKMKKVSHASALGKLNLFQAGPVWCIEGSALDRLKLIGKVTGDGLYSCYSQVTTKPNNLGLALGLHGLEESIQLLKFETMVGHWTNESLNRRLLEKHSRAAFILASVRVSKSKTCFRYDELIYCEKPTIDNFLNLVNQNSLVFEFIMSEKANGKVRNHGYPWRLVREEMLDQLFGVKIKLR